MVRPPIAILLAVISAILILVGRLNSDAWWGIWVLLAGIALLVIAGVITLVANRRRS